MSALVYPMASNVDCNGCSVFPLADFNYSKKMSQIKLYFTLNDEPLNFKLLNVPYSSLRVNQSLLILPQIGGTLCFIFIPSL